MIPYPLIGVKLAIFIFLLALFPENCSYGQDTDSHIKLYTDSLEPAHQPILIAQLSDNVGSDGAKSSSDTSLDELPPFVTRFGDELKDYVLGGGDVLKIIVYDEPDLSPGEIRISIDGYINFPLLRKVHIAGLTASELETKLQELLEDGFLLHPQVSVLVIQYASRKIFILGAVSRPGSYELRGQASLLEMISKAGGLNSNAGDKFVVLRLVEGKSESIVINRKRLIDEGDLSLNIHVENNDTLYVPGADVIFLFGEVRKPGPYQLTPHNKTLLSAINLAGGVTKIGAPKRTKIIRVVDGEVKTINVNLDDIIRKGDKAKDVVLKPEDVIIIPEALF